MKTGSVGQNHQWYCCRIMCTDLWILIVESLSRRLYHTHCLNSYFFFIIPGAIVKVNMSRLLLCEATANVIATGFHVLGINPLEKMWLNWRTKSISKPFNTAKLEDHKSNCTTLVNRHVNAINYIYHKFTFYSFIMILFLLRSWQLPRSFLFCFFFIYTWDLCNAVCQVMLFIRINP